MPAGLTNDAVRPRPLCRRDGAVWRRSPDPGALEVYRNCSARDPQDPAPLLAEAGQAPPDPTANPVLAAQLPAALAQLRQTHPTLAAAIATAAPHLNWITFDLYDPAQIGAFADNHCYASLLGQVATIPATDFDLGLFLIARHTLNRDHHHAAPGLYAPLTGPHGWRFRPDAAMHLKPAHAPDWSDPHRPHLTKVGPTHFLALFGWTRDVQAVAQVIPALDWPELEALRLDP